MGKLEKEETVADAVQSDGNAAPPSYNALPAATISPEDVEQLNSAFQSLELPLVAENVTVDTCLAHLKLLFAFQNLKESIGYSDGLWQIYDSRLFPDGKGADMLGENESLDDETKKNLTLLREKRWALYVARAAHRYEVWWTSFPKVPITEGDMCENTAKYTDFISHAPSNPATKSIVLPPLGNEPL